MTPKTEMPKILLLAAASLIGLDRALAILEAERSTIKTALARFTKVPVGELAASMVPLSPKRRQTRRAPVKPNGSGGPRFDFVGQEASKMHDVLLDAMSDKKPKPILQLLVALQRKGILRDAGPESRVMLTAFLAEDKTFACKTRGVYQLRRKPV